MNGALNGNQRILGRNTRRPPMGDWNRLDNRMVWNKEMERKMESQKNGRYFPPFTAVAKNRPEKTKGG
jgi:hypothetical protein